MIGAGSGEPEARRRRRTAAIAAPPASNAAGQSQTATCRERLPAPAGALQAFEPPAVRVAASPGLDTGFRRRSPLRGDRTSVEGDGATASRAGRASWSRDWVGRRVGNAWTAAGAARCARLTEPAPRSSSEEAPGLPVLRARATATGAAGAAGALAAGEDAVTAGAGGAGAGGAGAGGGAGVTGGVGVGAVGGATGAGRNSSGST